MPGLPDLVFTANAAVVLDRQALLARFRHPERQREEAHFEAAFRSLQAHGLLSPLQVLVSIVTITLFIPCIASIMMILKERGGRTALGMVLFIFPFALLVGGLLFRVLRLFGWS